MAKSICCRDVGVDCDFSATAETMEDLLQKCAEHASSAHGINEITPELLAAVHGAIKET